MKKILLIILSFTTLFVLAACGHDADGESVDEQLSGSVRYMNADPELLEAWQRIAKAYSEESGIPVEILCSNRDSYMEDLNYALNTDSAPVLFDVHTTAEFRQVEPICADLNGKKVLNQVITNAFSLSKDYIWNASGNFGAVGYSLDSYGMLVNRTLLEKAGYTFADIYDLKSLSAVSSDMQNRRDEIGIRNVFSATKTTELLPHLYDICAFKTLEENGFGNPQYLDEAVASAHNLVDLLTECGSGLSDYTDLDSFIRKETVFCFASLGDYSDWMEENIGYDKIGFLPVYCGTEDEEKQGLCTNALRYWCVNTNASEEDQAAALDFVSWIAEDEYANEILADEMGIYSPFVNAKTPRNPLAAIMYESLATRKNPMVNFLNVGYTG